MSLGMWNNWWSIRWWLIIGMTVLIAAILEFWEYQFASPLQINYDVLEILIVGLVFPILVIIAARWISPPRFLEKLTMATRSEGRAIRQQRPARVLVVENQSILGASLESLLSREKSLNVIGVLPRDEVALIKEIVRSRPDAVVLDEASYLTNPAKLLSMLLDYTDFQVLVVSAEEDRVQVFRKHLATIRGASDLVDLIVGA